MVRYDGQVVLDLKRLIFPSGKITSVLGPNGAGKTTLLQIIALLRRPTCGQISLWGRPASPADHELQRKVFMVMHPGYLFGHTVWQNVKFGLKARGVRSRRAGIRAGEALDMVGLSDFAQREISGLSAGERQRVNLARALAVEPQALLFDEPTANTDSQTSELISNLLVRLRDQLGTTIVHTSPTQSPLLRISDKTVELANGQVQHNPDTTDDH